jgi:hypothetical protein
MQQAIRDVIRAESFHGMQVHAAPQIISHSRHPRRLVLFLCHIVVFLAIAMRGVVSTVLAPLRIVVPYSNTSSLIPASIGSHRPTFALGI